MPTSQKQHHFAPKLSKYTPSGLSPAFGNLPKGSAEEMLPPVFGSAYARLVKGKKPASTYAAKLADPRWKQLRKKILTRDNYSCVACGSASDLHVHHMKYTGEPWEAPESDLVSLCPSCHRKEHHLLNSDPPVIEHMMHYPYALEKVGKEAPNTGNTLLRLMAKVDYENELCCHLPSVAVAFDITTASLRRHFHALREVGAIVPDPREEGRTQITLWRICPYLVWSGTGEKLRSYLKELPADHPFHSFQEPGK